MEGYKDRTNEIRDLFDYGYSAKGALYVRKAAKLTPSQIAMILEQLEWDKQIIAQLEDLIPVEEVIENEGS